MPLVIGQFLEMVDDNTAIVGSTTGELSRTKLQGAQVHALALLPFLLPPICATDSLLSPPGSNYYVRILSTLNRELLKPSASVALHRHS